MDSETTTKTKQRDKLQLKEPVFCERPFHVRGYPWTPGVGRDQVTRNRTGWYPFNSVRRREGFHTTTLGTVYSLEFPQREPTRPMNLTQIIFRMGTVQRTGPETLCPSGPVPTVFGTLRHPVHRKGFGHGWGRLSPPVTDNDVFVPSPPVTLRLLVRVPRSLGTLLCLSTSLRPNVHSTPRFRVTYEVTGWSEVSVSCSSSILTSPKVPSLVFRNLGFTDSNSSGH